MVGADKPERPEQIKGMGSTEGIEITWIQPPENGGSEVTRYDQAPQPSVHVLIQLKAGETADLL